MLVTTSAVGHALLIGSLFFVLIIEIVNTAIETTIERISSDQHPLSKKAKDLGSAAVMLSLANAAIIWLLVIAG